MIKVFISYSHKNEQQRERLGIHLAMLKRQGLVSEWHDRKLLAGQELVNEIDANLLDSQLVILLISSDFLASDYCYCQEMKKACELQGQGKIQIIPIIVDHCEWKQSPISSLLAIPQDGKPISEYSNPEKAYNEIAGAIRKVVESLSAVNGSSVIGDADIRSVRAEPIISDPVRSSNLTIKREFTDLDKNRFLKEGFDYIRKFFKNSLGELASRNQGIECDFDTPDNNSFVAQIYKGGAVAAQYLISNDIAKDIGVMQ